MPRSSTPRRRLASIAVGAEHTLTFPPARYAGGSPKAGLSATGWVPAS